MIPSSESALIISSQKGKIIVKHKFDCTVSLLKVAQFVSKVRMQTGLALSFFFVSRSLWVSQFSCLLHSELL